MIDKAKSMLTTWKLWSANFIMSHLLKTIKNYGKPGTSKNRLRLTSKYGDEIIFYQDKRRDSKTVCKGRLKQNQRRWIPWFWGIFFQSLTRKTSINLFIIFFTMQKLPFQYLYRFACQKLSASLLKQLL